MIPLIYDQVNAWTKDIDFYLDLIKNVNVTKIADLGCGTGRVTTHLAKAGYHITAIDPNEEAIQYAKKKGYQDEVTWLVGDSSNLQSNIYEAVIMTANVAQVFLTDESWKNVISDVYRALIPGGHFIFDTRNPQKKVWEQWEKDNTPDFATELVSGDPLEIWNQYEGFVDDVYTFYESVKNSRTDKELVRLKMQLKFRTQEEIHYSLQQVGFSQIQNYGDWEFKQATKEVSSFIFHSIK